MQSFLNDEFEDNTDVVDIAHDKAENPITDEDDDLDDLDDDFASTDTEFEGDDDGLNNYVGGGDEI